QRILRGLTIPSHFRATGEQLAFYHHSIFFVLFHQSKSLAFDTTRITPCLCSLWRALAHQASKSIQHPYATSLLWIDYFQILSPHGWAAGPGSRRQRLLTRSPPRSLPYRYPVRSVVPARSLGACEINDHQQQQQQRHLCSRASPPLHLLSPR
ncbi:unnamed protein product, partial [Ectocarpus sp. 8 AP-2014]